MSESACRRIRHDIILRAVVSCARSATTLPLGIAGQPGTAVPAALMARAAWAFGAVYTAVETEFLNDARAAGHEVMSGYELYFHQGVDAM